jgi:hypothetical protein
MHLRLLNLAIVWLTILIGLAVLIGLTVVSWTTADRWIAENVFSPDPAYPLHPITVSSCYVMLL